MSGPTCCEVGSLSSPTVVFSRGTSRTCFITTPCGSGVDPSSQSSRGRAQSTWRASFVQFVMLAKLGGDRVRHYLAAVDLSRLASVYCGVPTRLGIAVNGHLEIASANPLLHDLFKFGRRLLLLIQGPRSLFCFASLNSTRRRMASESQTKPSGGFF